MRERAQPAMTEQRAIFYPFESLFPKSSPPFVRVENYAVAHDFGFLAQVEKPMLHGRNEREKKHCADQERKFAPVNEERVGHEQYEPSYPGAPRFCVDKKHA